MAKAMNKMEQEWLNPSGNSRGNPKIGGMLSDKTGNPNQGDWYNDHTGMPSLYIGEKSLPSMGGGFNRPNIGQNVGDMPEGFTSGPGGRAMTQWYNKNTDQFWDAPSTGYTPGEGSGWVLSDSFDPYENTISDGRPQLKGIGGNSGNGYSSILYLMV